LRGASLTSKGDSGGGHFDRNGNLIGLLLGGLVKSDDIGDTIEQICAIAGICDDIDHIQEVVKVRE
jgi:hypothetical protein